MIRRKLGRPEKKESEKKKNYTIRIKEEERRQLEKLFGSVQVAINYFLDTLKDK